MGTVLTHPFLCLNRYRQNNKTIYVACYHSAAYSFTNKPKIGVAKWLAVHMEWMRTVCCRLKSDYSYSINIVYNAFPWCNPTEAQKKKIEMTAQAILDARAKYPDLSYADLYGEAMFLYGDLLNAHRANDMAVMEAYGFFMEPTPEHPSKWYSPSETVAALMKMYQELTEKSNG